MIFSSRLDLDHAVALAGVFPLMLGFPNRTMSRRPADATSPSILVRQAARRQLGLPIEICRGIQKKAPAEGDVLAHFASQI